MYILKVKLQPHQLFVDGLVLGMKMSDILQPLLDLWYHQIHTNPKRLDDRWCDLYGNGQSLYGLPQDHA